MNHTEATPNPARQWTARVDQHRPSKANGKAIRHPFLDQVHSLVDHPNTRLSIRIGNRWIVGSPICLCQH